MKLTQAVSDCGEDGCGECDVCQYLHWLEWAGSVAPRDFPSTVKRDAEIEAHLDRVYPDWRTA